MVLSSSPKRWRPEGKKEVREITHSGAQPAAPRSARRPPSSASLDAQRCYGSLADGAGLGGFGHGALRFR
jgi:hypothetical protein